MPCKTCCLKAPVNMRLIAAFLVLSILVVAVAESSEPTNECTPGSEYSKISSNSIYGYYLPLVSSLNFGKYRATCFSYSEGEQVNSYQNKLFLHKQLKGYLAEKEIKAPLTIFTAIPANRETSNRVTVQSFLPWGVTERTVWPRNAYIMIAVFRTKTKTTDPEEMYRFETKYIPNPPLIGNTFYPVYFACRKRC